MSVTYDEMFTLVMGIQKNQMEMMNILQFIQNEVSNISLKEDRIENLLIESKSSDNSSSSSIVSNEELTTQSFRNSQIKKEVSIFEDKVENSLTKQTDTYKEDRIEFLIESKSSDNSSSSSIVSNEELTTQSFRNSQIKKEVSIFEDKVENSLTKQTDTYTHSSKRKKSYNDTMLQRWNKGLSSEMYEPEEKLLLRHISERMSIFKVGIKDVEFFDEISCLTLSSRDMLDQIDTEPKDLGSSFKSFALLSVEDNESIVNYQSVGRTVFSPYLLSVGNICDSFPRVAASKSMNKDTLFSFCLPLGLTLRIIPGYLAIRAKELGWMGRKADNYAVHSFQDTAGNRTYGISITVKEEADAEHHICVENLKYLRNRKLAISKVFRVWRMYRRRKNFIDGAKGFLGAMKTSLLGEDAVKGDRYKRSLELASESYKTMINNSKLEDICIVERCYVLIGTNHENHSLLFSGLQQLIELEDKLRQEQKIDSPLTCQDIRLQRSIMLREISKMSLTSDQAKISYPKSELEHIRGTRETYETTLSSFLPKIQFTLPLPQIASEWGVAQLILRIGLSNLLLLIEVLLLERSVLIVGECSAEVTSFCLALFGLFKPYTWQSALMPTLTEDMMDFLSAPVPFIAGMVARNKKHLKEIIMDSRIRLEMDAGLTVINLSIGQVYWTTEREIRKSVFPHCKSTRNCWFVQNELHNYQKRIEQLAKNEGSSLHSFKEFFQNGFSSQETVVINAISASIQEYLANFSGLLAKEDDGFKMYGTIDNISGNRFFSASRFSKPTFHLLEFQKMFSQTQILASFYDEQKECYSDNIIISKHLYGVFIADWVYFHWVQFKQRRQRVIEILEREPQAPDRYGCGTMVLL